MQPAQSAATEDARRLSMAFGRALQFEEPEVQALMRYLQRIDAIEHELRLLQGASRGASGHPPPHDGPGTWREPHPVRE